jgi:hypothetical protein
VATQRFTYQAGAELPGLTLPWQEELTQDTWTDLDLSSGYTFTVTLVHTDGTSVSPSPTVTGADGSVAIAWATGDLAIATGTYELQLRANETSSSKDRDYRPGDPVQIVIV